jgi:hypothetical protein
MTLLEKFNSWRGKKTTPLTARYGALGERAADGAVAEVRHLPNTFALSAPWRYG